jgi:Spy/CpxP family protein refolding chaperone
MPEMRRVLKLTMVSAVAALAIAACGAGSQSSDVEPAGPAARPHTHHPPTSEGTAHDVATGSPAQDMRDIYAIKRQVNALRRQSSTAPRAQRTPGSTRTRGDGLPRGTG